MSNGTGELGQRLMYLYLIGGGLGLFLLGLIIGGVLF